MLQLPTCLISSSLLPWIVLTNVTPALQRSWYLCLDPSCSGAPPSPGHFLSSGVYVQILHKPPSMLGCFGWGVSLWCGGRVSAQAHLIYTLQNSPLWPSQLPGLSTSLHSLTYTSVHTHMHAPIDTWKQTISRPFSHLCKPTVSSRA